MSHMQQYEIKRKFFDVIEQIGDRTYKVQRKNDIYFLKDYGEDREGFDNFVDKLQTFKVCGVKTPKVYAYDKNQRIVVMEFIEGDTMDQYLSVADLTDGMYQKLFQTYWLAKQDKLYLDYRPENFVYSNDKFYYLAFDYKKFVNNDKFINQDIRLWFPTEELKNYIESRGFDFNASRIKSEYEANKFLTLVTIKYYR